LTEVESRGRAEEGVEAARLDDCWRVEVDVDFQAFEEKTILYSEGGTGADGIEKETALVEAGQDPNLEREM